MMRVVSMSSWTVLTAVAACSRAAPDPRPTGPAMTETAAIARVAAPTASAAGAPPASPAADPVDAAQRWSAALGAHDIEALRRLYGPRVLLYGTWLSRDGAVAAKASSFAARPDYRQSIDRVEVDDAEFPIRPLVTFHKSWTAAGQSHEVDASLVVTREHGTWKVVEESDAKTRDTASCSSLVTELVASTKEASALLHGPLDPAHGHVANGLRYGEDAEDRSYSVGVFEDHPDHLAMLEWFHVDPRTGAVTEQPPDGPALRADPTLASKVATDCWTEP
jgi:hypothetical protein